MTSRTALRVSVGLIAMCLLMSQSPIALASSNDDGGSGSGTIGVTVVDPTDTASPTPSASSTGSGSGTSSGGATSGSGDSGGSASGGQSSEPSPVASQTPAAGAADSGYVISGITTTPSRDLNPFGGAVWASLSVTNNMKTPLTGVFSFRLLSPFGNQLGPTIRRDVARVLPGETRTNTAALPGIAQWPLVLVSAKFTPTIHGDKPVIREAWVFLFPWLLIILIVAGIAVFVMLRIGRPEWFGRSVPAVA